MEDKKEVGLMPRYKGLERTDGKPVGPYFVLEFKDNNSLPGLSAYSWRVNIDGYNDLFGDLAGIIERDRNKRSQEDLRNDARALSYAFTDSLCWVNDPQVVVDILAGMLSDFDHEITEDDELGAKVCAARLALLNTTLGNDDE